MEALHTYQGALDRPRFEIAGESGANGAYAGRPGEGAYQPAYNRGEMTSGPRPPVHNQAAVTFGPLPAQNAERFDYPNSRRDLTGGVSFCGPGSYAPPRPYESPARAGLTFGEYRGYDSGPAQAADFSDYLRDCRLNVGKTDYFRQRGISDEVVKRFGLGFDEHFVAGTDQLSGQILWRAAIVPTGAHSYLARNTGECAPQERMRKKGAFELFNRAALKESGRIFVTEGEFDALSLESLGYHAVALGGASNVLAFADLLRDDRDGSRTYYICLDNDRAGREAGQKLTDRLYQYGLSHYHSVNLAFPYKDINDALIHDRAGLTERLEHLDELLSFTLPRQGKNPPAPVFIKASDDLSRLELSADLYTFTGQPAVLRRLCADLLRGRTRRVIYCATLSQWTHVCALTAQKENAAPQAGPAIGSVDYNAPAFLKLSPENPEETLKHALTAVAMQGDCDVVLLCDLSALLPQGALSAAQSLSAMAQEAGLPVIALCNTEVSPYIGAVALQNIEVKLLESGDFDCVTHDGEAKSLTFTRFSSV